MPAVERCPKCGGPVEAVHLDHRGGDNCTTECYSRALPDTLEGIEAEVDGHENQHYLNHAVKPILRRLFNGCAECGREPLVDMPERGHNSMEFGKRQAYQHAAEGLEAAAKRYRAYPQGSSTKDGAHRMVAWHLENHAADLRQLAEGE